MTTREGLYPGLTHLGALILFAVALPGASSAEPEPPARAPLDALWQEHMLTGTAATIYVDESGQRAMSIPRRLFDEQHGEPHPDSNDTTRRLLRDLRADPDGIVPLVVR